MKAYKLFFLVLLSLASCSEQETNEEKTKASNHSTVESVPNNIVEKEALNYDRHTSQWTLNGSLFSGYALSKFDNDSLQLKIGILNGMKHNATTDWYPNGQVKSIVHYKQGKLHGEKKLWLNDSAHTLVAHLQFENGQAEGEQKKWYPTGEPFQILHMKDGREEGTQQAFRKNGDLYANYQAKNGRIFGLKKAALCFGLEDQKIKDEE